MRIEEVIGHNIRARREELGRSQEELGREVGTRLRGDDWPRQAVSTAEKGGRGFTAVELVVFASVLEISVDRLFGLPLGETSIHLPQGVAIDGASIRRASEDGTPLDQAVGEAMKTLNALVLAHREVQKAQSWEVDAVIKLEKQLQDIADRAGGDGADQQ